jgi:hypothetical protein
VVSSPNQDMKKITYNDVYNLGEKVDITTGVVRSSWFPEIADMDEVVYGFPANALDASGRFEVRQVIGEDLDYERSVSMHTLWFDGSPVAIVRNAGRGEKDDERRWITDRNKFDALISHVRGVVSDSINSDVVDPFSEIYPEEVFSFGCGYWGDKVGVPCEKTMAGIVILWSSHLRLKNAPAGYELVSQNLDEVVEMPEYIRREGFIAKRVRSLTDQDYANHPQLNRSRGNEALHWYAPSSDAPACAVIVPV